jgi:hypothetical protein
MLSLLTRLLVPNGTGSTPRRLAARAIGAAFSERFWSCEGAFEKD